ncbi:hypothetical protein D3C86_1405450 [compost metagenome]
MQLIGGLRDVGRINPLKNVARLFITPLTQHEAHRFGQEIHDQRQQQQRQDRHVKHRLPAETRDQHNAQPGGQHAAHRVTTEHDRDQRAADFFRRVLVHQCHDVRHHAANAEPGNEATEAELGGVSGETIEHGETTEEHHADRDGFLAADPVRQRTEEQRAEHHAEQCITAQCTGLQRTEPPLFHQHRQDHAVDHQIVTVEDDDQGTPEQHHPVKAVETSVVDNLMYVDLAHGIYLLLLFY